MKAALEVVECSPKPTDKATDSIRLTDRLILFLKILRMTASSSSLCRRLILANQIDSIKSVLIQESRFDFTLLNLARRAAYRNAR